MKFFKKGKCSELNFRKFWPGSRHLRPFPDRPDPISSLTELFNTHPRNRFLSNPYSFLNRPEGRKDNSCIYVFLYFLSTSHKDSTCISAPNSTLQYGGYGSCPKYLLPWLTTTVHLLTKVTRYKVPPFVSRCQPMGPLCL